MDDALPPPSGAMSLVAEKSGAYGSLNYASDAEIASVGGRSDVVERLPTSVYVSNNDNDDDDDGGGGGGSGETKGLLQHKDLPHGMHPGGASELLAVWNIVCTIAGVGILSMPKAMNDSGWVGVGVLVLAAVIADYTGKLLIRCLYVNRSHRLIGGYPEIGEAAFGRAGYYVVQFFHKSTLLGVCTLFLIIAGDYMFVITGVLDSLLWSLIIGGAVWVPLITLKTMREIALVSMVGVLASAIVVVVVVQQSLTSGVTNAPHQAFNLKTFPTAFASMAFAYGGNAVYPHIEQSMQRPKNFGKALTVSMALASAMYFPTAIVGYYVYGDLNPILDNLPQGEIPVLLAQIFITAHVILAYPMPMMAVVLELEPFIVRGAAYMLRNEGFAAPSKVAWTEWGVRAVLRTLIVAATVVVAVALAGEFGLFFDLVAAFSNTALIFILPVVFYWRLAGAYRGHMVEIAIGALVVLLGLFAGGVGTYNAIEALVNAFSD